MTYKTCSLEHGIMKPILEYILTLLNTNIESNIMVVWQYPRQLADVVPPSYWDE